MIAPTGRSSVIRPLVVQASSLVPRPRVWVCVCVCVGGGGGGGGKLYKALSRGVWGHAPQGNPDAI